MPEIITEFTPTIDDAVEITDLGERAYANDRYTHAAWPRLPSGEVNPRIRALRIDRTEKLLIDPRVMCKAIVISNGDGEHQEGRKIIAFTAFIKPKKTIPQEEDTGIDFTNTTGLPADLGEYANLDVLLPLYKEGAEKKEQIMGKDEDFYYVRAMMTDPEYGRRGLGSRLMRWGFEIAEANGKEVFIEASEEGKPFYERLGCEEVGEIVILDGKYRITLFVKRSTKPQGQNSRGVISTN